MATRSLDSQNVFWGWGSRGAVDSTHIRYLAHERLKKVFFINLF